MIPSPKTAKRVRAPPENRLRKLSTPPLDEALSSDWSCLKSIPGMGTQDPSRYTRMITTVNRILFRRSGTLNMFFKLESVFFIAVPSSYRHRRDLGRRMEKAPPHL